MKVGPFLLSICLLFYIVVLYYCIIVDTCYELKHSILHLYYRTNGGRIIVQMGDDYRTNGGRLSYKWGKHYRTNGGRGEAPPPSMAIAYSQGDPSPWESSLLPNLGTGTKWLLPSMDTHYRTNGGRGEAPPPSMAIAYSQGDPSPWESSLLPK